MSAAKVIRVVAIGTTERPPADCWLESFDVDAHDGRGDAAWTSDVARAMRFPDVGAAMTAWRTQSTVRPLRDDGLPNRPLTALTIQIEDAP